MKKIMFNDKYGLTDAVLKGMKTQTRRVIKLTETDKEYLDTAFDWDLHEAVIIDRYAKHKVGEVVAVAQSYRDVSNEVHMFATKVRGKEYRAGWGNKMFVKAELMPHHIKITNIRVERLKYIRDEDCMKEGIYRICDFWCFKDIKKDDFGHYRTPREAFSALIDKVSGKGTWDNNPYVFVYEFERVD